MSKMSERHQEAVEAVREMFANAAYRAKQHGMSLNQFEEAFEQFLRESSLVADLDYFATERHPDGGPL